jgi:hypothetical protein
MKTAVDSAGIHWLIICRYSSMSNDILATPVIGEKHGLSVRIILGMAGIFLLCTSIILKITNYENISNLIFLGGVLIVILAINAIRFRRVSNSVKMKDIPIIISLKIYIAIFICSWFLIILRLALLIDEISKWQ